MMPRNRWAVAWSGLTAAFALHVLDEATHDFLRYYNPNALRWQERLGFPFPPVFSFELWLGGLLSAVLLLALLTPLIRPGARWAITAAYIYGAVHTANAIGHIGRSVVGQWLAPGVLSSPILLATALWLLHETNRVRRAAAAQPLTPA
ncbi:MAG TPA: HXXEE domain-containing protein [Gemmatimonadaceae bacterium]|nr:HXXEE domain-containing protein [Gemmatimonadaceae bacterium]